MDKIQTRDVLLRQLLSDCNLCALDTLPWCKGATNSFVSYDGCSTSMIDYICLPVEHVNSVQHAELVDDNCLNVSQHRSVVCTVQFPCILYEPVPNSQSSIDRINWKKVTSDHVKSYREIFSGHKDVQNLKYVTFHRDDIDPAVAMVTSAILNSANLTLPKVKFKSFLKSYWNDDLNELHKKMLEARRVWCCTGRPRNPDNVYFRQYKDAKRIVRKLDRLAVHRYIAKEYDEIDKWQKLIVICFGSW